MSDRTEVKSDMDVALDDVERARWFMNHILPHEAALRGWLSRRRAPAGELKQWLAGDRRRRGAFIRAKSIWMRSESARALGPQYDPENFQPAVAAQPC